MENLKFGALQGGAFLSASMKDWEIIADNLSKAGWSWGSVSAVDSIGRTIWIVDAHRGEGRRFVVRADEMLTAFLELEKAVRPSRKRGFDRARHVDVRDAFIVRA